APPTLPRSSSAPGSGFLNGEPKDFPWIRHLISAVWRAATPANEGSNPRVAQNHAVATALVNAFAQTIGFSARGGSDPNLIMGQWSPSAFKQDRVAARQYI